MTGAAAVHFALTAGGATAVAPLPTDVVVQVWVASTADLVEVCARVGAEPVESAPNVVLLQERDDTPLAFRARGGGVWTTDVFRLYCDLRRDPHRGRELSGHLRSEVIGF